MHEGLPICYVKPTILCIDDDVPITDALDGLISKQYSIICFNKTTELLDYIKNYESIFSQNKLFREFTESEYSDVPTSLLIQFNLKTINDLIDNSNITKEIALIIVDNSMPDMNGLLLCEKLKDYTFEKILYTGTEDYKSGLEAMNSDIIM
ncbi:MAG: hypothetical protein K2P99_04270 [Burkholderiales bacterium]|nr:hypothetical protein [Burkholderiales bacterium]